jgi:hypothetical protein
MWRATVRVIAHRVPAAMSLSSLCLSPNFGDSGVLQSAVNQHPWEQED